jgi:hypothetical protein
VSPRWEVVGGAGPLEVAAIVAALECLLDPGAAESGSSGTELDRWTLSGRPGGEAGNAEPRRGREAGWTGSEGGGPRA